MGYELESAPMWADVQSVLGSGQKPVKFEYRGQFHTVKEDFTVMKIISIDVIRDYANNIGDQLHVKFKITLGDYMVRFYPFRANLEFSIKRITLTEGSSNKAPDTKVDVVRYKAVFPSDMCPVPTGSDLDQYDYETLNNADVLDITLQLLDRSLEPLRIKTVYGVFRGVTPKQVINSFLGGESIKVLIDGKPAVDGVDVVDPDNTDTQSNLVFPSGSILTGIPTYLQEKLCGVYATGVGTYLQYYNGKHLWFVYPLFNTKRFKAGKVDRVIIYAIPQDRFTGVDRTYFKDGSVLKIIATTNKKYNDDADTGFMNRGSGFRMADARTFMKKPVELTPDGPKAVRTQLNHESVTEDRADGLNFAPSNNGPSSNPFVMYSKIQSMKVARVDFVWENSDPEQLYPGMPCKYVFLDNNKQVELDGTLVFTHTVESLQTNGIASNIYKNVTAMTLLVDQVTSDQKFKNRPYPVIKDQGVF